MLTTLRHALTLSAAVLALTTSCDKRDPPRGIGNAITLSSVPSKYECYPAPSPFYKPGTVVRKRRSSENPEHVDMHSSAIVSLFSPFKDYPAAGAVDYSARFKRTYDGKLLATVMKTLLPNGEIKADKEYEVEFSLKGNDELVLDDTSFNEVSQNFRQKIDDAQMRELPDYKYFWIKEAIFSSDMEYRISDTAGGKLGFDINLAPVEITLALEKRREAKAEVSSKQGVIACVVIEPLQVRLTHGAEGTVALLVAREKSPVDSDSTLLLILDESEPLVRDDGF